jgi:hypothetical protein
MADGRQGPCVVGALTAITGGMLLLAAAAVIPLPDETLGGPRWLVAPIDALALVAWFVVVRWLTHRPAP